MHVIPLLVAEAASRPLVSTADIAVAVDSQEVANRLKPYQLVGINYLLQLASQEVRGQGRRGEGVEEEEPGRGLQVQNKRGRARRSEEEGSRGGGGQGRPGGRAYKTERGAGAGAAEVGGELDGKVGGIGKGW